MTIAAVLMAACLAAAQFIGHVCTPGGAGKHPAIVLLGGSEGGDRMQFVAPRFAKAGYVAASVAYFGAPGLPSSLENIPVETVGNALNAIAARPDVDANRIAIMGYSKGGEFALLVASLYPQIHAAIAAVPSPFAWQGIAQGYGAPQSSWTYHGKPLPYVAYGTAMMQIFGPASAGKALRLRPGYEGSLQENAAQIPAAMFHLENIDGPVRFVSAGDDGIWNSTKQSQMGLQYLQQHKHRFADAIDDYPGAGHLFLFATPSRPMTSAPLGTMTLDLGGSAAANVAAGAQEWPKLIVFLAQALK